VPVHHVIRIPIVIVADDSLTVSSAEQTAPARPHPGRRRPRSEAKRAAIMQAAARLFLEQGPQAISMDRVATVCRRRPVSAG